MAIKRFILGIFGENTYLITKGDKAVLVDPGQNIESIKDVISLYKVEAILITHGHIDHMDGVGIVDAPIYVGSKDQKNFSDLSYSLYNLCNSKPNYDNSKLKLIPVFDGDEIVLDDFNFKVIETPGHTSGSVCYRYYDNLFTGDTLFKGSIGRTDFPSGSNLMMRDSLKKLLDIIEDNVVIYPGHEDNTVMKMERKTNPFLKK